MVKKDYYAILGITPGASQEMVEAAYDRVPKGKTDETVEEAYAILSDPQARLQYDRLYKIIKEVGQGFDGLDSTRVSDADFNHVLGLQALTTEVDSLQENLRQLFSEEEWEAIVGDSELDGLSLEDWTNLLEGMIMGLKTKQPTPVTKNEVAKIEATNDLTLNLPVNQAEAQKGGIKSLGYERYSECKECQGSGSRTRRSYANCAVCAGSGKNAITQAECLVCAGLGRYPKENCLNCRGTGRVLVRRRVNIVIPEKINSGDCLRITAAGNRHFRRSAYGDLVVKINLQNESDN